MHKRILFLVIFLIAINFGLKAQEDTAVYNSKIKLRKAIKEKLIEKLNIDEETANKFLKLLNDQKKTIEEYNKEKKSILKYLEDNPEAADAMDRINEFMNIDDKINKSRKDFIEELKKIMTPQQISKAIIFQKNLRKMFYKDKGKP